MRREGDEADARALIQIVFDAIRALEASPNARERMRRAKEWPTFVPGGEELAPLRKAWAKRFALRDVGEDNPDIPKRSSVHLELGTPAWLAKTVFDELDELRRFGPLPVKLTVPTNPAFKPEPEYMTAARSLPALSGETVKHWRDLAILFIQSQNADWKWWMKFLNRNQTYKTKRGSKKAASDDDVARWVVSVALFAGFHALTKLGSAVK